MDLVTAILIWIALLSSVVMAGVYFTFSAFVMRSLAVLQRPSGMLAMRSINEVILKSAFLPIFFAGTLASLALTILAVTGMTTSGSTEMALGGVCYFVGMLLVTVVGNVPLNNRLAVANPETQEGGDMWEEYLRSWTRWNHVRTVSCLAATIFLVLALLART